MSRSPRSRPSRVAIGVCAGLTALLLGGCAAGQLTWTSTQRSSSGGANGGAPGGVVVRDAEIVYATSDKPGVAYPSHASAPLQLRIVNEGPTADRLVSASSEDALQVVISGPTTVPGGQELVVGPQPGTAEPISTDLEAVAPSTTTSPTTSPTTSAGTSPTSATGAATSTPGSPTSPTAPTSGVTTADTDAEAAEAPAPGGTQIVLTGLTDEVRSGETYPVVLEFEKAGKIALNVPVDIPNTPREPAAE